MKPEAVQHNIRQLSKGGSRKLYNRRLEVVMFCRSQKYLSFGIKPQVINGKCHSSHLYGNQTCLECNVYDAEPTGKSDENFIVAAQNNRTVQMSSLLNDSDFLLRRLIWIKELCSSQVPSDLVGFEVKEIVFEVFHYYKMEIGIDRKSELDFCLPQEHLTTSFSELSLLDSQLDTSSFCISIREGYIRFHCTLYPFFSLTVFTVSRCVCSSIVMESLTEHHWNRLKGLNNFFKILNEFSQVSHQISKVKPEEEKNYKFKCELFMMMNNGIKLMTKATESLSFFADLSIEDQLIVLKESFCSLFCLHLVHAYNEEIQSYVYSAVGGRLSLCVHKDRLRIHSTNKYSKELAQFYDSFLDQFYGFLRKDYFVICILSVLCILQDKPGLSCSETFEEERRFYYEILDSYIKAKVTSNEWLLDRDSIWVHIHWVAKELLRHSIIYTKFLGQTVLQNKATVTDVQEAKTQT